MAQTQIAIVGGGLAGSTAAAMLGRAGISATLIDPHRVYPQDFRCEKIGGYQLEILKRTGISEPVLRATTLDSAVWTARLGRLIEKRPSDQHGILYDDLVNTVRRQIPQNVQFVESKVTAISTGDLQMLTLSNGDEISARLVVMANGLNIGLRHLLGIERDVISPCHSITVGFNVVPFGRSAFAFPALTYFTEHAAARMAYLTLFPIGEAMRANLMVYRTMDDPWLSRMRHTPEAAIEELMPNLRKLMGQFRVEGQIKIRPADLYVTRGHLQGGVVLVGDAFATSCPAAGTGTDKVFTDVERLCNFHIPRWLRSDGMGVDKINAFYSDPEKRACDEASKRAAYSLRSISVDTRLSWHARRWIRFAVRLGLGTLRNLRGTAATRHLASQRN